MATYLYQVAYTSKAWETQVDNAQHPRERIRPAIEKLGGRIESMYYAFGEYDIIAIIEFPDNGSAAAFEIAAAAGGAVKAIQTTPLLSLDEGVQAMERAGEAGYRPPSS